MLSHPLFLGSDEGALRESLAQHTRALGGTFVADASPGRPAKAGPGAAGGGGGAAAATNEQQPGGEGAPPRTAAPVLRPGVTSVVIEETLNEDGGVASPRVGARTPQPRPTAAAALAASLPARPATQPGATPASQRGATRGAGAAGAAAGAAGAAAGAAGAGAAPRARRVSSPALPPARLSNRLEALSMPAAKRERGSSPGARAAAAAAAAKAGGRGSSPPQPPHRRGGGSAGGASAARVDALVSLGGVSGAASDDDDGASSRASGHAGSRRGRGSSFGASRADSLRRAADESPSPQHSGRGGGAAPAAEPWEEGPAHRPRRVSSRVAASADVGEHAMGAQAERVRRLSAPGRHDERSRGERIRRLSESADDSATRGDAVLARVSAAVDAGGEGGGGEGELGKPFDSRQSFGGRVWTTNPEAAAAAEAALRSSGQ